MSRASTAFLLALAATLPLACSDGRGPLVLYSPHGRDLLDAVEKSYEASHPEVDVRWLDMGSQEVFDRLRSETANPQADVWFGGPATLFERGAAEGLLAPYRPDWADAVPPESRRDDALYFGLYRTIPVIVVNEAAVPPDERPRDWADLLDPRWKGRILIRDPLASGTMRTCFAMLIARSIAETGSEDAGWDYLRRLDAQTKEYVHNPALLKQKLIRQEGEVTIWTHPDVLLQRRIGAPLRSIFPASGTPVIDDSIGLVAHAPHAETAKAFVDWVGSKEAVALAMEASAFLPARTDLDPATLPDWARETREQLVEEHFDRALVAAREAEWMNRWDREVRAHGGG